MPIITGNDLAAYMGVNDTEDSTEFDLAADTACDVAVGWAGRSFDKTEIVDASARTYHADTSGYLMVHDFWSTTGLVVKTDDNDDGTYETTWTYGTDFALRPSNGLKRGRPWPYEEIIAVGLRRFPTMTNRAAVQVTAAWGWSSIPAPIRTATLIEGARLFRRKDSPEGILGGFEAFGPVRVSHFDDPDFVRPLSGYRRVARSVAIG